MKELIALVKSVINHKRYTQSQIDAAIKMLSGEELKARLAEVTQ